MAVLPAPGFLLLRYYHDCEESDVKQYSLLNTPLKNFSDIQYGVKCA